MKQTLKGIILDFDGLICDTETPEVEAWRAVLPKYGLEFSLNSYLDTVGAVFSDINAGQLPGIDISDDTTKSQIITDFNREFYDLVNQEKLRPGLENILKKCLEEGIKLGVASSSPRKWVVSHLERLQIEHHFKCIITRENVQKTKPDPELFLRAINCFSLKNDEIIVFEDSPNGVAAAKKACLFTIAIPNQITKNLDFRNADLVLNSFNEFNLQEYLNY